mgnify:CR=1 FL=1
MPPHHGTPELFLCYGAGSILQAGFSTVEIDIDKQRAYLRENGVDVESMSEDEIKKAATGSHVFLKASIHILDAIEDVAIEITI